MTSYLLSAVVYFYPRSPCGERPPGRAPLSRVIGISIHALLAESDDCDILFIERCSLFLSTLSLRRATAGKGPAVKGYRNFYPRSPCGERRAAYRQASLSHRISIHALLAESDFASPFSIFWICHFYPRSPCGERQAVDVPRNTIRVFLSTLSLRRATSITNTAKSKKQNFYPRSPCGERLIDNVYSL